MKHDDSNYFLTEIQIGKCNTSFKNCKNKILQNWNGMNDQIKDQKLQK